MRGDTIFRRTNTGGRSVPPVLIEFRLQFNLKLSMLEYANGENARVILTEHARAPFPDAQKL